MRLMILLHEYSHKYKNPKIGLEISNEIGADINALYIYLGLGFSKIDAICVFANVFLSAQTPDNLERMRKINDYIQRFESQEYAKLN
jgi:ferritin